MHQLKHFSSLRQLPCKTSSRVTILLWGLSIHLITALVARAVEPLDQWTRVKSGTELNFQAITYGNGQFVAVGDNGLIATSYDGTAWTVQKSGITHSLHDIAFNESQFVIVGSIPSSDHDGIVLRSTNGIDWKQNEEIISNTLSAIDYGNGRFVAGSYGSLSHPLLYTSEDGENWKPTWQRKSNWTDPAWIGGLAFGDGLFVAVFPKNDEALPASSLVSTNGYNWELNKIPRGVEKVTFGNGLFVGVGQWVQFVDRQYIGHALIHTSIDGVNWIKRLDVEGVPYNAFYDVSYGSGQFLAVGSRYVFSSANGKDWVQRGYHIDGSERKGVAFGAGRFVNVGVGGFAEASSSIGKLGASRSPSGQFIGTLSGMSGQKYSIQSSGRLEDWTTFTNLTITNGTGQFVDSSTNGSNRFYKASPIAK